MKISGFTEEQIIRILREAATGEQTIGSVCRAHGSSENTGYTWRKKYGGVDVAAVKRRRELAQEHARLKRLLAERDLELDVVKDVLAKKGGARSSDVTPCSRCVRAACRSVGVARCATSAVQACAPNHGPRGWYKTSHSRCAAARLPTSIPATASAAPMRWCVARERG